MTANFSLAGLSAAAKGKTGENLLQTLELRFDNVVFRLGFADTRNEARQLVRAIWAARGAHERLSDSSALALLDDELAGRVESLAV